jgi:hypothetical protein
MAASVCLTMASKAADSAANLLRAELLADPEATIKEGSTSLKVTR